MLTRGAHRIVHRDKLGDIGRQAVARSVADFLSDGDHDRGAMRQHEFLFGEVPGQCERNGDTRLPVEMTRDDEAVRGELGAGDQPDEVTHGEAESTKSSLDETFRSMRTSTCSQSVGWVSISSPKA